MPDEPNQEQAVITIQEASTQSGIPRRTLYNAAVKGSLKTIRPGPPWLTTPEYLKEYVRIYIPRPRDVKK